MKKVFFLFFFVLSFLFISTSFSQNVIKSQTILSILGKKFYIHIVKKGETLNAISKAYNVSVQDIISMNSNLENEVESSQVIKIPIIENQTIVEETIPEEEQYVYHTVQRKQTLYSIAKKYNIEESELIRLNPDVRNGIKSGQVIKIPKNPNTSFHKPDNKYLYHKVGKKETLFSIAQKFNIEISDITELNPSTKNGLKDGQILKLPKNKTNLTDSNPKKEPNYNENKNNSDIKFYHDAKYQPCNKYKYESNHTFKVALLLPLYVDDNYNRSFEYKDKPEKWFYKYSGKFYEFYQGALMAVEYMKRQGVSIHLYVYDTGNDASKVDDIIAKPGFSEIDLIIGPVYTEQLKIVGDFAKKHKISIISPLSQNEDLVRNNPFIFQVSPSSDVRNEMLFEHFSELSDATIMFIHNNTPDEITNLHICKTKLSKLNQNGKNFGFKEIYFKQARQETFEDALSVGKTNIIVMTSNDEVFVTEVVTKLFEYSKAYNIMLYGTPNWEKFQNIDYHYFHRLKLHYPTILYTDYQKWEVKNFVTKFRDVFKTEPTPYAFQGYDITNYFMSALKKYGKYFQACINESDSMPDKTGLIIDFNFQKISSWGGFVNEAVFILSVDKDMNLSKIVIKK